MGLSKISAVLPVTLAGREAEAPFGLLDNLFLSLKKFAQPGLFERFFIIAPPRDVEPLKAYAEKIDYVNIEVIDEVALVPSLANYAGIVDGWRLQQILKLAIAERVATPFYLTFDQDIFFTHPVSEEKLLPDGKALTQYEAKAVHKKWWRSSAFHLKMKTRLNEDGIQVTPAILSTEATQGLIKELSAKVDWVDKLLEPHLPTSKARFHPRWKHRHRWTEYTLYWLYLEKHNLVETYHADSSIGYTLLSEKAVWKIEGLDGWDPDACFADGDKSLFSLVQSSTGMPSKFVLDKIKKYIS
ncbi:MAG: DUF6492 family protein [Spongiibacter sp.]|nr:DUF6492 family protein [Spongiibacter sp.]